MVTFTWHANKYCKVHKLHQRCIFKKRCPAPLPPPPNSFKPIISGTLGNTGVYRHKTEPVQLRFLSSVMFVLPSAWWWRWAWHPCVFVHSAPPWSLCVHHLPVLSCPQHSGSSDASSNPSVVTAVPASSSAPPAQGIDQPDFRTAAEKYAEREEALKPSQHQSRSFKYLQDLMDSGKGKERRSLVFSSGP